MKKMKNSLLIIFISIWLSACCYEQEIETIFPEYSLELFPNGVNQITAFSQFELHVQILLRTLESPNMASISVVTQLYILKIAKQDIWVSTTTTDSALNT